MKRCTVEHLNFTRSYCNRIQVRWKNLFCPYSAVYLPYEFKRERIIEIGPHLPKLS